jgi:hypothetical protein
MTTDSNTPPSKGRKSPRCGIGAFLAIIVLTFIFFLLAQSMVRHRFHEGGWVNRNGSIVTIAASSRRGGSGRGHLR